MPLTLEQYADYLDKRQLSWPSPPEVAPPKARPYLVRLPNIRAVTWSAYGTLLAIRFMSVDGTPIASSTSPCAASVRS